MKNMTLSLIDKKYTVEMNSHEYIKHMAYKLGISVEKGHEVSLKEFYVNLVEIFHERLICTKDPMMSVADIQEYAETLHTISMMFDLGTKEEVTSSPISSDIQQTSVVARQLGEIGAKVLQGEGPKVIGKIDLSGKPAATYVRKYNIYVASIRKEVGIGGSSDNFYYTDSNGIEHKCNEIDYRLLEAALNAIYIDSLGVHVSSIGIDDDTESCWYINEDGDKYSCKYGDYQIMYNIMNPIH